MVMKDQRKYLVFIQRFYTVSYTEIMKLPVQCDETKVYHRGEEDATLSVF